MHPVLKCFSLAHVKSHQDDSTEFDKLPFSAQLNVLCDNMATAQLKRQQQLHANERTLEFPLTPRNLPVEISYRQNVISSHYVSILREEIGLARHRIFLQHKYKWTNQIWNDIAWDSFHLCARRTHNANACFRSKLVHNWLHLGHRRAKQQSSSTVSSHISNCPMCQAPEDLCHLLTCSSPRALKIRYDATAVLRKALDNSPGTSALLRAVKQWTSAPDAPVHICPGESSFSLSINAALCNQTSIGWVNLFRGFVSLRWGGISDSHDTTTTSPDASLQAVVPRLATTVRALQNYTLALWVGRNAILHEHSLQSLSIVYATLDQDITQMYSLRDTFSDHLTSYFGLPLEDRLRHPPRQRKRWLRLVRLATSHASSLGRRQQLISIYFPFVDVGDSLFLPSPAFGIADTSDTHTPAVVAARSTVLLQQPTISSYFPGTHGPTPLAVASRPSTSHAVTLSPSQLRSTASAFPSSPSATHSLSGHHV